MDVNSVGTENTAPVYTPASAPVEATPTEQEDTTPAPSNTQVDIIA